MKNKDAQKYILSRLKENKKKNWDSFIKSLVNDNNVRKYIRNSIFNLQTGGDSNEKRERRAGYFNFDQINDRIKFNEDDNELYENIKIYCVSSTTGFYCYIIGDKRTNTIYCVFQGIKSILNALKTAKIYTKKICPRSRKGVYERIYDGLTFEQNNNESAQIKKEEDREKENGGIYANLYDMIKPVFLPILYCIEVYQLIILTRR